jgi:hypothetical protein
VPTGDPYPALGRRTRGLCVGQHLEVHGPRVVGVHDHLGHDAEWRAIICEHTPGAEIERGSPIEAVSLSEWLQRHA